MAAEIRCLGLRSLASNVVASDQDRRTLSSLPPTEADSVSPSSVVIKVGMVGDSQIGKTSLMVKYVEGSFE